MMGWNNAPHGDDNDGSPAVISDKRQQSDSSIMRCNSKLAVTDCAPGGEI